MRITGILLTILLFAVSQGAYAQTELDTLQKELNKITQELKDLRKQKTIIVRDQTALQRVEDIIINNRLTGGEIVSYSDLTLISRTLPNPPEYNTSSRLDLSRRFEELQTLKTELQRQEAKITKQQEALQRREKEIKKQQKALQGQEDEAVAG